MKTIQQLLDDKGSTTWSISPEDSVHEAVQLMHRYNIGALLVLHKQALCGLLSERDCARKIILENKTPRETPVEAIMSREVFTTFPDDSIENCMAVMTHLRIRHLPVIDPQNESIIGLVSIGDLVKAIIDEQQQTIEQLEQYITS